MATDREPLTGFSGMQGRYRISDTAVNRHAAEFSQKTTQPIRCIASFRFGHFSQFAIFITKTATYILKNTIFIYLIFNELNYFSSLILSKKFCIFADKKI